MRTYGLLFFLSFFSRPSLGAVAQYQLHLSQDSAARSRPVLCLLPAGGLSGKSWGPIDILLQSFDVAVVDPPGTGGLAAEDKSTLEGDVAAIETELKKLQRPLVLSGISFGFIYAIDLAHRRNLDVKGLVGFSVVLSNKGIDFAKSLYQLQIDAIVQEGASIPAATRAFHFRPSETTFRRLLDLQAPFFVGESNVEMVRAILREDSSSFRNYHQVVLPFFHGPRADYIRRLRLFEGKKVLVAARGDRMVPSISIEADALETLCAFRIIENAAHFVSYDQPESVAEVFESFFL
jgi:pimeloyl-ACP methyl ester carboxylesterase